MFARIFVAIVALSPCVLAAEGDWEGELRQMGYLFLHISNINVVNGLNLTREQASTLRGLALEMEAAAPRPPSLRGPMSPGLAGCRAAWLELREVLLAGRPVPTGLGQRVNLGRVAESKAVRATVRAAPAGGGTACTNCHAAPSASPGQPMQLAPGTRGLMNLAHTEGIYGKRGIWKLLQLSPRVEAVLTESQKSILGSFACCLVPPQSLSDPVRAGQAESSEKAVEMLRKVRECPEAWWPLMRGGILGVADKFTEAASPGATAARKAAAREGVAKALDRARKCSDTEFEMEKDALSKSVKDAIVPAPGEGPHKAAFFLLIPGASEVYASYLKR